MKSKIVILSIAVLAALICGLSPAARADDQKEIADMERKYVLTTDPDEVMKYWDTGEDVVLYDPMPPREFAGEQAIRNHMADFAGNKDLKVDFLELQVISDCKLALARSVQHFTAEGADGKAIDATYRSTDLWRKTHGHWKIINSHVSFPVDLKTGKADMQSKM